MARQSSLMEWLEQTKRISKAIDYICLDTIDSIFSILYAIEPKIIRRHSDFFDYFCNLYHKPNPADLLKKTKKEQISFFKKFQKRKIREECFDCPVPVRVLSRFVEGSILRCKQGMKDTLWLWFEVIDFMYERPELVNPAVIDEYMETKINEVCLKHRKNNPLTNGMREKFGKFYKDEDGKWQPERRKRF